VHVVATAGHVDHGKSTLVRALTGMEPDRFEEERRRGLTLDLGFAWTTLDVPGPGGPRASDVAVVDVPGHERFVATMLAGVGPVPAVLFVVAADSGWMPQSTEHLDALTALGVRHGLLVITRSDLGDADLAVEEARDHLAGSPLADVEAVAVTAPTGAGMDDLRVALGRVLAALPVPDPAASVRLWVDRAFTIRGAGTVITGTLAAGTLAVGDELELSGGVGGGVRAVVRGLHSLGRAVPAVRGVARVAVNLRGVDVDAARRGSALTTPGTTVSTAEVDVLLRRRAPDAATGVHGRPEPAPALPEQLLLHLGSAAVPVHVRPLDAGETLARLRLRAALPLRIGDVGLLRDPGAHRVVAGVTVLDPAPPPLRRRGAARARAQVLAGLDGTADAAGELARRGLARRADLAAMGVPAAGLDAVAGADGVLTDGEWLLDPAAASPLRHRLAAEVAAAARERPLEPGLPVEAARRRLGLPSAALVTALLGTGEAASLELVEGRLRERGAGTGGPALPPGVQAAVDAVLAELADAPYAAPEAHRLRELGLGSRELAAAVRAGVLVKVADGVVLAPGALAAAAQPLAALPQPFTLSEARQAWGTSRRVAVPLLELLDRRGLTRRLPDARRELVG